MRIDTLNALARVIRDEQDERARNMLGLRIGRACEKENTSFNWAIWNNACNTTLAVESL